MKLRMIWAVLALWLVGILALAGCQKTGDVPETPIPTQPVESAPIIEALTPSPRPGQEAETPDPQPSQEGETPDLQPEGNNALTAAELAEWEDWLNEVTVCELFWSGFAHPDEVKLSEMFYDGAGEGTGFITDEEWKAIEELKGTLHTDLTKVTFEEVRNAAFRVLDIDLTREEIGQGLEYWTYLPQYDAWYHQHGDTMRIHVDCLSGQWLGETASLLLTCEANGTVYTVMLEEMKDYFVISSILPAEG